MEFVDRRDAGRQLADRLLPLAEEHPVVLALPRGGVPVAFEVSAALGAALDVLVVRKIGCPWQPELGLGAIGEDGAQVRNEELIRETGVTEADLAAVVERESAELARRLARYRGLRSPVPLEGRVALIVDDGLATGSTARVAVEVARRRGARKVVVAVPVAAVAAVTQLSRVADDVVCVQCPDYLPGIGAYYDDFSQIGDDEVRRLLDQAAPPSEGGDDASRVQVDRRSVAVQVAPGLALPGELVVPDRPVGTVLFAHGSGSSHRSPRNVAVARSLNRAGLATLLFDLLTQEEASDRRRVFDIELLADRLIAATGWWRQASEAPATRLGYFGASTGAAAALWAAAGLTGEVAAIVSRGGRPDLAARRLPEVVAPTLLIVGSRDPQVLDLNRSARAALRCQTELEVVAGATHLFEEPGALEAVASLAGDWFGRYLVGDPARADGSGSTMR